MIKTPSLAVQGAWGQAGAQKVQRSVGPSYPSLQLDTSYQGSLASCLSVVSALPSPAHHTPLGARDRALSPQVSSIPQLGCHLRPGGALSSVGQCPGRPHHHGALFTPVKRRTVAGSVCAGAREAAWVPACNPWVGEFPSPHPGRPGRQVCGRSPSCIPVDVKGTLVFDKLVDVVLCPMLAGGDLEDKSDDQQGLL